MQLRTIRPGTYLDGTLMSLAGGREVARLCVSQPRAWPFGEGGRLTSSPTKFRANPFSSLHLQFTIDKRPDLWYGYVCYLEETSLIPSVTPGLTLQNLEGSALRKVAKTRNSKL